MLVQFSIKNSISLTVFFSRTLIVFNLFFRVGRVKFDVGMQRCLKISPADEILAPEIDRLKSVVNNPNTRKIKLEEHPVVKDMPEEEGNQEL